MDSARATTILQRAQAGEPDAVEELLREHYSRIRRVCARILDNAADVDDATQETLVRIVRYLPRFDHRSSFETWSYRIATNCSIDELRKRRRGPHLRSLDADIERGVAPPIDVAAGEQVESIAQRAAFDDLLASLDPVYRIPLVLRDVATMSYQEIADHLSVPVGTVKSRIARARHQLVELLDLGNQSSLANVSPSETPASDHD